MYLNCLSEGTNDSSIDGAVANSSKLSSSRYKGVVPQPNGRWGAQIYEKHRRVWLGTFNDEEEAAKAYYIASLRFRGIEAITNFKQNASISYTDGDEKDTLFLESHSKSEIVDMLRKHSYTNELETFKHKLHNAGDGEGGGKRIKCHIDFMNKCDQKEWLFEKVATPSDVGRLNRMVIPKQQAEKHFPLSAKFSDYHIHRSVPVYLAPEGGALSKGVLLNFEDDEGKVWRFRYCYWGSSQSYVLTKGWTRFVKEKKLKAGDVVLFLRSAGKDKKLFIECRPKKVDVSRFEEMMNPVEPLTTVQDYGAVRLFGVNIMETWSSCFERAPISLQFV